MTAGPRIPSRRLLLAADVGGTKTLLGLYDGDTDPPSLVDTRRFATPDHDGLVAIVDAFLQDRREPVAAACLGVAGPVRERRCRLTNVPWTVSADELETRCTIGSVRLLNDVAAAACAIPALRNDQLAILQTGRPQPGGTRALLSAGTGLGEALLAGDDGRLVPIATEAGHSDFPARTARELELVATLTSARGRVSCEDILSGPGLVTLFDFTHGTVSCPALPVPITTADLPAAVADSGLRGACGHCQEALALFVEALGAEAGNLALRAATTGGVYLGGGIPAKILPALSTDRFLRAFRAKPPMTDLLLTVPVAVVTDPTATLLGAAIAAQQVLDAPS